MIHKAKGGEVAADAPAKGHPRTRRRAETTTELLDHAERVVLSEGLEALSMHRLAAEHGVRVAALYRYWASKDALLSALLERAVVRTREAVAAIEPFESALVGRSRKSWSNQEQALLRLVRLAGVYFELARARPEVTSLIAHFLAPARPVLEPSAGGPLLVHAMGLLGEVSAAFERAAELGALSTGDATQRTALYWTSLAGLVAAAKLTRFGIGGDRAQLERTLVQTLLVGWGAPPELLTRSLDRAL
jgi:AcrR family transcriptional regulator